MAVAVQSQGASRTRNRTLREMIGNSLTPWNQRRCRVRFAYFLVCFIAVCPQQLNQQSAQQALIEALIADWRLSNRHTCERQTLFSSMYARPKLECRDSAVELTCSAARIPFDAASLHPIFESSQTGRRHRGRNREASTACRRCCSASAL